MFFIRAVVLIAQHDMNNTLQSKKKNQRKNKGARPQKSYWEQCVMFEPIVEPIVQTLRRVKPRENASEITHKILGCLNCSVTENKEGKQ